MSSERLLRPTSLGIFLQFGNRLSLSTSITARGQLDSVNRPLRIAPDEDNEMDRRELRVGPGLRRDQPLHELPDSLRIRLPRPQPSKRIVIRYATEAVKETRRDKS